MHIRKMKFLRALKMPVLKNEYNKIELVELWA